MVGLLKCLAMAQADLADLAGRDERGNRKMVLDRFFGSLHNGTPEAHTRMRARAHAPHHSGWPHTWSRKSKQ